MSRKTDTQFINYLLFKGKTYPNKLLPPDIKRGKLGHCFDNCAVVALDGKYKYVEGIAQDPFNRQRFVLHAWLTDGEYCYDPTWKAINEENEEMVIPTWYFGVEMSIRYVAVFMLATKYTGIFANGWRNKELARKCVKDIPTNKINSEFLLKLID